MTLPREVLPGRSYMITRRCTQRQFLLRPDAETNQAVLYCLAEAAQRFEMDLYWLGTTSNHYHDGVGDPHGNYPKFIAHFHRMLAKVLNARWGRWENFWASEQTSVVQLVEPEDCFEKMVYSLVNPVKAGLVSRAEQWPGASSLDAQLKDKTLTIERPRWFFRKDGTMPARVELHFKRPPGFEQLSEAAWRQRIRRAVAEQEQQAARERRKRRGSVAGAEQLRRQSPFRKPRRSARRRQLSPRVACRNKWRRIEALARNAEFQRRYRAAYRAYHGGKRGVVFPAGTYQLRQLAHVRVEPAPSS